MSPYTRYIYLRTASPSPAALLAPPPSSSSSVDDTTDTRRAAPVTFGFRLEAKADLPLGTEYLLLLLEGSAEVTGDTDCSHKNEATPWPSMEGGASSLWPEVNNANNVKQARQNTKLQGGQAWEGGHSAFGSNPAQRNESVGTHH